MLSIGKKGTAKASDPEKVSARELRAPGDGWAQ